MFNRDDWINSECWIACFDILGFKKLVSFESGEMKAEWVMYGYEETLKHLEKACADYCPDQIDYLWLSDTFVMFTQDDSASSFGIIEHAATFFMDKCIYHSQIPLRGAISVGQMTRRRDNRALMGKGIVDAFVYAECQDWIGLILTPDVVERAESAGICLTYLFVLSEDVPMHEPDSDTKGLWAYKFQSAGQHITNLIMKGLHSMKSASGSQHQPKYEKTEKFILKHCPQVE